MPAKHTPLTKRFIAEAIAARDTALYKNEPDYKGVDYKEEILPQARFRFREYDKLYKKDEDFVKYFARDYNNKNKKLLEEINLGELTAEEQAQALVEEVSQETSAGESAAVGTTAGGEVPSTMAESRSGTRPFIPSQPTSTAPIIRRGESPTPPEVKTPVPKAFEDAFKNEPEYILDPTKKPTKPPLKQYDVLSKPDVGGRFEAGESLKGYTKVVSGVEKKVASRAGIAFKGASTQAGIGLKSILGGIASGGIGIAGGAGLSSVDFLTRTSAQISKGSLIKFPRKKILLVFASLISIVFGVSALASLFTPPQTIGTTPNPISAVPGLNYTLPLRDAGVSPQDIRDQITAGWPNAQIDNWNLIIGRAVSAGWNPALVLALWVEESGAQGVSSYTDALGCAPGQPTTDINVSLDCLFNNFSQFNNNQFPEFMARYSSGPASNPFANNPNFPTNLKSWYTRLVPSGRGAVTSLTPVSGVVGAVASCPVVGGAISTPSYQANSTSGHCGGTYSYSCHCGTTGRRAKAIDVPTKGEDVVLPKIENKEVKWSMVIAPYSVDSGEGGGVGYTFKANLGSDTWYLDMLHLSPSVLKMGEEYESGTRVAKTVIDHVHMTIGKNLSSSPVAGSATDCDSGWLASDFMCQ